MTGLWLCMKLAFKKFLALMPIYTFAVLWSLRAGFLPLTGFLEVYGGYVAA